MSHLPYWAFSKSYTLNLILREPLLCSVIEFCGARALVRRHLLRVFERAAIGEISGDAGRAERVIADRGKDAGGDRAPSDHAPGIRLVYRLFGEHGGVVSAAGAEQPALAVLADAGRGNIGVQRLGERLGLANLDLLDQGAHEFASLSDDCSFGSARIPRLAQVLSSQGARANSGSHGESDSLLEVGRATRMLVRMGMRLRRRREAAEARVPQQSADLRRGSWLASAHGKGVHNRRPGVRRPDARHRLRDEEVAR